MKSLRTGGRRPAAGLLAVALPFLALGGGCSPDVPILMYHAIGDAHEAYTVSETDFVAHLDWLKSAGFNTVSLGQLVDSEEGKSKLPDHPVVLTFDDGFEDAYRVAFPRLRERGQVAAFFVVTRFTGTDESTRRVEGKGTPKERRFLIWSEVREMAAEGMEIGSHSLWHRRLPDLAADQIRSDVQQSRQELEENLGRRVDFFAYPFNSERKQVRRIVEASGYRAAVSGARSTGDRFELPRIGVHRGMSVSDLRDRLEASWASSYTAGGN
jgi:peptidoglycan/xylan/chitin deacetylase (PgdA/CDA1 family)